MNQQIKALQVSCLVGKPSYPTSLTRTQLLQASTYKKWHDRDSQIMLQEKFRSKSDTRVFALYESLATTTSQSSSPASSSSSLMNMNRIALLKSAMLPRKSMIQGLLFGTEEDGGGGTSKETEPLVQMEQQPHPRHVDQEVQNPILINQEQQQKQEQAISSKGVHDVHSHSQDQQQTHEAQTGTKLIGRRPFGDPRLQGNQTSLSTISRHKLLADPIHHDQ
jgi:hypothetical protein